MNTRFSKGATRSWILAHAIFPQPKGRIDGKKKNNRRYYSLTPHHLPLSPFSFPLSVDSIILAPVLCQAQPQREFEIILLRRGSCEAG